MHPIIYDVAVSLDGYISGPDGDVSGFAQGGPVVDDYVARLATYSVAIMGRATYEFGYHYGMEPGQNPYSSLTTYVFSDTLVLPTSSDVAVLPAADHAAIMGLKRDASGPIYLCGGGAFAGALLEMGLIDLVRLKRAPLVLGGGVPLFSGVGACAFESRLETRVYTSGYVFEELVP